MQRVGERPEFLRSAIGIDAVVALNGDKIPPGAAGVLLNQTHMFDDLFLPVNEVEKQMYDAISDHGVTHLSGAPFVMAALLGALPLAIQEGTGAELRKPLGITIVGGLIVSQMLTLYTTPVVYLALDRLRLRVMGKERDTFHPADGTAAARAE